MKRLYLVGGNTELRVGGGANISISNLEIELDKLGYDVKVVGANYVEGVAYSFARLRHISFSPLTSFKITKLYRNWADAIMLFNYFYKTTRGIVKIKSKDTDSLVVNNGHWCLDSDIIVVRFCMRSYLRCLKDANLYKKLFKYLDLKMFIILWIERSMLKRKSVRKIVTLSKDSLNSLLSEYPEVKEKTVVIRSGVDKENFRFSPMERARFRDELGIKNHETVALFIAGNVYRKNLGIILEVILSSELANRLRWIILIKAEESQMVERLSKYKNVIVKYWAGKPSAYYNASDFLIFPTIYDTGAKVVLEALANGLYCIVSKNSSVGEFINANEGVVVNGNDSLSYTTEIRKFLISNKSQNHNHGEGRNVLSWTDVANMYNHLI